MPCAAEPADVDMGSAFVRLRFLGTLFAGASSEGDGLCELLGRLWERTGSGVGDSPPVEGRESSK